jgi:hypothetical protein
VKRTRPSGALGKLIQTAAAAATGLINSLIESRKQLMICSEFVYRAYDEASNAQPDPYGLDVPGVATRESVLLPGATRRSLDPDSVLGRLQAHPELLRAATPSAAEGVRQLAARPLPQPVLEAQVNRLLAEHLAEVEYGRPARAAVEESFVSDESIAAAIVGMGVAFDAMDQTSRGGSRERALASAAAESMSDIPAAMRRFFQTAADLVTPADLRRSSSLADASRAH